MHFWAIILSVVTLLSADAVNRVYLPPEAAPYASVLRGDVSTVIGEDSQSRLAYAFTNLTSSEFNPILSIRDRWEYTLVDLDGDGGPELFLHPTDAWYVHFILHAEEDGLRVWDCKEVGMYYWFQPLSDGRIMETMSRDGANCYSFSQFDANGNETRTGESWMYRYDDRIGWIGPPEHESPAWAHNDVSLSQAEYERLFAQEVTDYFITDWRPAPISFIYREETP